jgi:hypothetical protein
MAKKKNNFRAKHRKVPQKRHRVYLSIYQQDFLGDYLNFRLGCFFGILRIVGFEMPRTFDGEGACLV